MFKNIFLIISFLYLNVAFSQSETLSENSKISILTCGHGKELYTTFGHTAIRVQDSSNQLDIVFNYGMFDFSEGNFYLKFVKGNLQYYAASSSFEQFLYEYQYEKREVVEQTLNLTLKQKQKLFESLTTSLYSEDKYYTYKFIDKNCTTMVVEKLNAVLDNSSKIKKISHSETTYREVLFPYFENYFWYKLGINIIFGQRVDENATTLFLPIELLQSLNHIKINGIPIVNKNEVIIKAEQPETAFNFFNSIYIIWSFILILFITNKKIIYNLFLICLGILGIFFIWVGSYSLHKELLYNYNILLFNPLLILIALVKNKRVLQVITTINLITLLLYFILMITKPHLSLVLPIIIIVSYVLIKKNKNIIQNKVVKNLA